MNHSHRRCFDCGEYVAPDRIIPPSKDRFINRQHNCQSQVRIRSTSRQVNYIQDPPLCMSSRDVRMSSCDKITLFCHTVHGCICGIPGLVVPTGVAVSVFAVTALEGETPDYCVDDFSVMSL